MTAAEIADPRTDPFDLAHAENVVGTPPANWREAFDRLSEESNDFLLLQASRSP